ncbi:MAG: PKD-like family lipoprotein [Ginsengibacter sp.]
MKKLFLYTILLCTSIFVLNSCRKDFSSLNTNKINGIEFDTTGQSSLSVFQFEKLVVKPVLKMDGVKQSDLKFEWRLNVAPGSLDYEIVGTERDLNFEMKKIPTKADQFYQLLYVVTDQTNDLKYITAWPVTVRNSIGEGLVIATSSDGVNSDISHIMSPLVTSNYSSESIKRNVYSAVNGKTIPGLLKQIRYTKLAAQGEIMMAISDNTILAVKTLDYSLIGMNEDLFFTPVAGRKNDQIGDLTQIDVYIGNGRLTAVWLEINKKFGVPYDNKYTVPAHVGLNGHSNNPAVVISYYDEVKGAFVYQPAITAWGDRNTYLLASSPQGGFDPAAIEGKVNLAAGVTQSGDFLHILKSKTGNGIGLYIIDPGGYDANWNLTKPSPKEMVDLSGAPDIQNAKRFVLLDDQKVLYYATTTKIYAVLYGSSTPAFSERYTVSSGEEITTLQVYRQADYPKKPVGDPSYISTNNKQLIMSTYKGTEGKVYIMPMINLGLGNIDVPNIKVYGGFNRISAIGTQR